jgi:hypothetical protein
MENMCLEHGSLIKIEVTQFVTRIHNLVVQLKLR